MIFMKRERILALINRRERQILVHSYLYYELDESLISDDKWSEWAKELCELRDTFPKIFQNSEYVITFSTFDPSTGFDLRAAYTRPEIERVALYLLRISKRARPHE